MEVGRALKLTAIGIVWMLPLLVWALCMAAFWVGLARHWPVGWLVVLGLLAFLPVLGSVLTVAILIVIAMQAAGREERRCM